MASKKTPFFRIHRLRKLTSRKTTKSSFERFHSTFGVDNFLLPGVVRMALGANVYFQIFAKRTFGFKGIATAAMNRNGFVLGMNIGFHFVSLTILPLSDEMLGTVGF